MTATIDPIRWLPPRDKPWNESAGHLGYYCRTYLPTVFDLIDFDGAWPAAWLYNKQRLTVMRVFEEKPKGQELHDSQRRALVSLDRILRNAAGATGVGDQWLDGNSGVFVIYDAERLSESPPRFPIRLSRITEAARFPAQPIDRPDFDRWMLLEDEAMGRTAT